MLEHSLILKLPINKRERRSIYFRKTILITFLQRHVTYLHHHLKYIMKYSVLSKSQSFKNGWPMMVGEVGGHRQYSIIQIIFTTG